MISKQRVIIKIGNQFLEIDFRAYKRVSEVFERLNIAPVGIPVEEYTYKACEPEVRRQVLKLAVDGTGIRATGRILGISKDSVTDI